MDIPKGISASFLKWVAVVTMTIDHAAAAFFDTGILSHMNGDIAFGYGAETFRNVSTACHMIGRIAFPIFVFLLVEGFTHTRSVRKYGIRLLLMAIMSEIPFNLVLAGNLFYPDHQNVYFTLFIGLVCMYWISRFGDNRAYALVIMGGGMLIAYLLKTDYSYFGVFAICLMYLLKHDSKEEAIVGGLMFFWEVTAVLAIPLMLCYDKTRGRQNKWFFYLYYPIHLTVVYLIAVLFIIPKLA